MTTRWTESPLVLATAGTVAIHVILAVCADAIVVTHPFHLAPPASHIELIEIEPPRVIEPARAPEVHKTEPAKQDPVKPVIKQSHVAPARAQPTERPTELPHAPPTTDPVPSGGAPVVAMDNIAPSAKGVGVPVAKGSRTTGHVGQGGSGDGAGSGAGSGDHPVSIATIKTRALPKGDYGFFAAGKDYPPEAKALGIEGPIRVKLVVNDQGRVQSAVLLKPGLGHGLDELALGRARTIEFDPARDTDDRPVTSVVIWTFTMTLPK